MKINISQSTSPFLWWWPAFSEQRKCSSVNLDHSKSFNGAALKREEVSKALVVLPNLQSLFCFAISPAFLTSWRWNTQNWVIPLLTFCRKATRNRSPLVFPEDKTENPGNVENDKNIIAEDIKHGKQCRPEQSNNHKTAVHALRNQWNGSVQG